MGNVTITGANASKQFANTRWIDICITHIVDNNGIWRTVADTEKIVHLPNELWDGDIKIINCEDFETFSDLLYYFEARNINFDSMIFHIREL